MFDAIVETFNRFRELGLDDPLVETLCLFNILSGGCLGDNDMSDIKSMDFELDNVIEGRKNGVPMEYLIGKATFMGLTMCCTPDTLIPRRDTELLVSTSLRLIKEKQKIQDKINIIELGIGCGNIAVSLALNTKDVKILASDISPEAIEVASNNILQYKLEDRISLYCGDLFAPFANLELHESIDLVVCNPPYVPTGSLQKLDPTITDHEPILALDAGTYGISIYRRLINDSVQYLRNEGILIFEIGAGQDKFVSRLLKKNGNYTGIEFHNYEKDVRVISAVKTLKA